MKKNIPDVLVADGEQVKDLAGTVVADVHYGPKCRDNRELAVLFAKAPALAARVAELETERNAIDKRRGELSECLSSIRLEFLAGSRGNAMSREWAEWMAEVVGRVLNGSSMESAEAESERHAGALP